MQGVADPVDHVGTSRTVTDLQNELVRGEGKPDVRVFVVAFEGDVEETRKYLLAYCKMDTLAMVEILKKLKLLNDE